MRPTSGRGSAWLLLLTVPVILANFDTSECDKTKICALHPPTCAQGPIENCDYAFSYAPLDGEPKRYDMELYTRRPEARLNYVSVGFSNDQVMGEDLVIHCASAGGQPVEVHLSQNPPATKANTPISPEVDAAALSLTASESDESHIYCKFVLKYDASAQQNLPDHATQYYLLFARGPTGSPQRISIHDTEYGGPNFPVATNYQLNLLRQPRAPEAAPPAAAPDEPVTASSTPSSSASDPESGPFSLKYSTKRLFVRIHGLIMVLAWIIFVAIAVFSARYLRDLWPSTTPFGLKLWFLIHRTLNVIAVAMMALAAVFILLGKDLRWTGPWTDKDSDSNWKAGSVHSLLGLIAVVLALAQPFVALTRCGADHPKRPIFNVFHRTVGIVAAVLAVVTLSIALLKFTKLLSDPVWAVVVFALYIVLAIAIVVAVEVIQRKYTKQQQLTAIEMRSKSSPATDNYYYHTQRAASAKAQQLTTVLFGAFILISVGSAIILFIMILP